MLWSPAPDSMRPRHWWTRRVARPGSSTSTGRHRARRRTDVSEIRAWMVAERGEFYRPVKEQITLRLDKDVLAWFKAGARDTRRGSTKRSARTFSRIYPRRTLEGGRTLMGIFNTLMCECPLPDPKHHNRGADLSPRRRLNSRPIEGGVRNRARRRSVEALELGSRRSPWRYRLTFGTPPPYRTIREPPATERRVIESYSGGSSGLGGTLIPRRSR